MYKLVRPSARLQHYVEYFWFGEITLQQNQTLKHNAIASSKTELLFHYQGNFEAINASGDLNPTFTAGFYGQTNLSKEYMSSSNKAGIFGVRFYPHAIPALFSIPAFELTNKSFDIVTLLGNQSIELTERVFMAMHDEKIKIISAFLENKLKEPKLKYKRIEATLYHIHRSKGLITVKDLVKLSCLSQRQFERNFKELAGFSPKSYLKIVRFESVISAYEQSKKTLTGLALAYGYFDQAHFNHDFKKFTGQTPSSYLNSLSETLL